MNYIFSFLIITSIICALITGKMAQLTDGLFQSAKLAVEIAIGLIGIMGFWLGIVNIAKKSGLMEIFAKAINKPLIKIFPEIKDNPEAVSNVALNISANALGLSNAATPFGIKAMENMQEENKDKNKATNAMCTFLAMNTAGFQIVPATVLAIVTTAGMNNPTQIIIPTLIVTSFAFVCAIVFAKMLERYF
ncbi:nucleoside recognition protein [bacterium]|nr:nucleoside recognition protein [bacterium]